MRLKHFLSVFLTLLTLSVGHVWGTDATMGGDYACTVNGSTAKRAGTSSAAGSMTITVPNGATVLSFYCAAWNGESPTVSVTPAAKVGTSSFSPSADTGISNNSPFTLSGTESSYLRTITLNSITSETTLTFANSAKKKRFVVWGPKYVFNPTSPTNGEIGSTTAALSWSYDNNTDKYEVYYSTSNTAPNANTTPSVNSTTIGTTKSVNLTGLTSSQQYYWWVRAVDDYCKSAWVAGSSFTTTASGCTNNINIGKGSESHGTFTLSESGPQATCSGLSVVVTPDADDHYHVSSVSATTGETGTDNGDGTWTITYAANTTGSSTINVVFAEDPAATISFENAGTPAPTTTGYYVDDSYTLPSSNNYSCSGGKTFVGWSTVEVASQDTKPSSNFHEPGASVTLGASQTFRAVFANATPGEAVKYDPFSATLGGSSGNTITSGYTLTTQASSQAGYYQDGSGTLRYVQVASTTAMFSSTPSSISVTAKIGGGTSNTDLANPVYAQLVDANGDPIGTAAIITEHITTNTGDTYSNISIPTTGITSAYGLRIYHTKESGYNVRYYSMSLSYTVDGTTYSAYSTDCCSPLGSINGSVSLSQNSATLTWDDLEGVAASNPYAVTYRKGSDAYGSANVGEITTNAQSKKTCTITGLECGTEYDFKIAVTGDGSHCDAEQVLEDKSTTKWIITYNLTNTVEKTAGPETGANACGEIEATFTKNSSYTFPDAITVTVGGAALATNQYTWNSSTGALSIAEDKVTGDVAITIAGVAPANPIVTPSPSALSFAQVKKGAAVPAAKDITITGQNLTDDLTVTSSDPTLYDVSVKSGSLIPDGDKNASPVITVTPQEGITSTAGDKNATITISGGGLSEDVVVNVTFNVQETYTVNWYVNGTKIDANSKTDVEGTAVTAPSDFSTCTDCSELHFVGWATSAIAVAGTITEPGLVTPISAIGTTATTNYYAVFAEGTPGGTPKLFEETFAESNGSSGWSGNGIASGNSVAYDNEGWSADKAYGNGGSVRFGTSSAQGYALTPEIDVDGSATLTFKSGAWAGDKTEDGLVLTVEKGAATLTPATLTLTDSEWHANEVAITGAEGPIKIKFSAAQPDKNRFFLDEVVVSQTSAPVYTKWYTTCPHVARVTLSAAEVSNGSISFEQSGSAVTNVRTDGGADVDVDVVPDPATGYELTGVALSGVAGASYDAGVITIPQDAEGTLTVTATFSKKNYTVTMAQTGGASAELSEDQSNKHYNDVITVTAEDKAGYVFKGWTASPAVTFANAKALETTFSMPNGNVTVTAAYAKVYTPAEALALDDLTDSVYVEGVISQVDEVSTQYKNATYWISADGTTTNQIKIYRGKHINKADVTADNAAQIAVGNKVRVRGKLSQSSNVNQFGQSASYITVLVEKILSALTIVGDASVTTYDVGDSFDKTGLSLSATYNTGYVQANYTGTTITSNYDAPTTFTAGVTSVTVSAEEGLISTSRDIPVTVSSAVLDHVEISAAAQTEFWAKEAYKEPLLDAYLDDETELPGVTGVSNTASLDMSVAGNKSVTVTYTRKAGQEANVEYNFTVKPVVVDEAHAHSVATAREIIDVDKTDGEDLDLDLEGTKTHVVGVVTSVSALTGTNAGKYTIVIKDQTDAAKVMTLYQVTLKSGITSVAQDDIIKAYGNLYYHSQSSKYEINTGGEVVAVVRTPNLTVADVAEMEVNITADLAEADLTIDKDGSNGAITFSCSDAAVTIVNNKLHAAEAGDATVTATIEADGIYTAASTTFNVHVIAERQRYAVNFDANGGSGDDPEYDNQLEGATVTLPECSYSWAKHGFTGWTVINLSTSAEIEIENNQFTMPAANVKIQAQWEEIATTHIVFNVNGNTETVAAVDVPQAVEYSITQETDGQNGYEFVGWAENPETEDVETVLTTISTYTPEAGEASKTLYAVFKRVDEGAPKTDVLTAAELAATSTTYMDFSNVSKTSNAVYAGNSAKNDADAIQLRSKESNSGIVSTTTGGVLKSVTINVASGSNTIDVYGSNTAYNAASDLYATGNNGNQGTKIGSTSSTATINAEEDYKFVGIRSNNGAIYLSSVEIVWQPKTTYYTTAPAAVYDVTYALGTEPNGTWKANEGCENAKVKVGQIFSICEDEPVRDHNKFNGWAVERNDTHAAVSVANNQFTMPAAAVTVSAVWVAKVESNVTYNAGTGTGDDAVDGNNEEGAEIVLPSAADKSLSKEGYDFVGWLYGGDLYEAGTTFEMPASAVTFVAQWKKQNITKMTLVTDVAQLVDGSKVVIAQAEITDDACKTMGAQGSNNRSAEASTVDGNVISVGEGTNEFTLVTLENNQFAFQASNGNYLYAASSGNNYLREQAAIDGNASWTISIASNGVATIKAQGTNTNNWMRYNSGSTLFSCYGSGQQDIAIYANVTAVTENASISELGYVEGDVIVVSSGATLTLDAPSAPASITVKENAVVNVSAATEAGTVIVEKGAKLAIEEGGSVTTDEPLVLYTTLGKGTGSNTSGNAPGSSSEIINAEQLNATGDVYLEIELTQDAKASAGWYAFSVPFPVDAMNGVYYGDTKLTNEVGYAIMSYHGDVRAQGLYGWKKYREIMQPGVLYVITVGNTDYKTLRFKKVAGANLAVTNSDVAVNAYPSTNPANAAWNGIGNPNLAISNLSTSVPVMQFYDHKTNTFIGRNHSVNLVVGSAFFIQYYGGETVSIPVGTTSNNGYLAPRREQKAVEEMIYEVQLTNVATGELEDNVFLTAREDAKNEYEIGRDVAKMSMGAAKCAQMYVPAYGTNLCAADFQLVNDKAEYPLTITAPADGTYRIEAAEAYEGATLYLTKDGRVMWNLSMSACEVELTKGTTENYGLLLVRKAPGVATGMENVESQESRAESAEKVIIDNQVFILRGGQMYDLTGKKIEK